MSSFFLRRRLRWLLCVLLALPCAVPAQVTIYRCTDAKGAVTFQNDVPCPAGSKEVKRSMDAAPALKGPAPAASTSTPPPGFGVPVVPAPAAPAMPAATVPALPPADTTAPAPRPAAPITATVSDRLPPPPLYECTSYANDRYFSDISNPPERCVALQTVGLDGSNALAAGSACQMMADTCQRVVDEKACEGWKVRLRDAQSQAKFGVGDARDQASADLDRLQSIVRDSTCGL